MCRTPSLNFFESSTTPRRDFLALSNNAGSAADSDFFEKNPLIPGKKIPLSFNDTDEATFFHSHGRYSVLRCALDRNRYRLDSIEMHCSVVRLILLCYDCVGMDKCLTTEEHSLIEGVAAKSQGQFIHLGNGLRL